MQAQIFVLIGRVLKYYKCEKSFVFLLTKRGNGVIIYAKYEKKFIFREVIYAVGGSADR